MAVICFSSFQIPIQKSHPIINTKNKTMMLKYTQISLRKSHLLQARSFKNKVFENQSEGIICYRDENGEIICEGFDEGPRFNLPLRPIYNSRDAGIINLLHQRLLEVVNGGEIKKSGNGVAAIQEDFKWN